MFLTIVLRAYRFEKRYKNREKIEYQRKVADNITLCPALETWTPFANLKNFFHGNFYKAFAVFLML